MKQNTKSNTFSKMLIFILLATIITSLSIAGYAWAKYKTNLTGEVTGKIAKWSFKLKVGEETSGTIDLAEGLNFEHVKSGVIAPGTNGQFDLELDASECEVSVRYTVLLDLVEKPTNLILYSDEEHTSPLEVEGNKITITGEILLSDIKAGRGTVTKPIYWDWPYTTGNTEENKVTNDMIDTAQQGSNVLIRVTATGVQMLPNEVVEVGKNDIEMLDPILLSGTESDGIFAYLMGDGTTVNGAKIVGTGSVTNIPDCSSSTNILNNIPEELRNQISYVKIEPVITSIGNFAFSGCSNLTSVIIPSSVTSIGMGAFAYCSSLTSITIPAGVTSIGNGAFAECSDLTSVTIPGSVNSIGIGAFQKCSSLTSVTIPASVTSVGNQAFYECSNLTSVTISVGVTSIGSQAFSGCSSLTSVIIPASVTSIGDGVFSYCSSLTSVTILASTISISNGAFNECSNLTSVTILEGVTSIGNSAFANCSSLTSVTIPGSVTSIGSGAFGLCSSLTNVTISEGVTSIGNSAFAYCSSLTSVTIPASVTSIYSGAFGGCSGLTAINVRHESKPSGWSDSWAGDCSDKVVWNYTDD